MMRLPRIQYAVPELPHVRSEIAKAMALVEAGERAGEPSVLKAAADDPAHPGWPAGTPDGKGGQFRPKGSAAQAGSSARWPDMGHNQGPPLEEPPEIPTQPPATPRGITSFIKAAAYWLATAGETAAGRFLAQLNGVVWLIQLLPLIYAYIYPPKTLAEIQEDAQNPQPGYQIHHIVERTPARQDGFGDTEIESPDNLVRIPTLKHWQITTWYQTKNPEFGNQSPRDYLRGKSWDDRVRVGKYALIKFGVLKP